jgi:hypothetical protein
VPLAVVVAAVRLPPQFNRLQIKRRLLMQVLIKALMKEQP